MTVCCEHNECPDRPKRRLRRFLTQPWRCPQCGQWWYTIHAHDYSDYDTGGHYEWCHDERGES